VEEPGVITDEAVDEFVAANLSSFACWDLATLASRHPETRACTAEWSDMLARPEKDVALALAGMSGCGLFVEESAADGTSLYRLCDDARKRSVLSRFVEQSGTRERRLEFVRTVIARHADS
jgi:hypothetical protein